MSSVSTPTLPSVTLEDHYYAHPEYQRSVPLEGKVLAAGYWTFGTPVLLTLPIFLMNGPEGSVPSWLHPVLAVLVGTGLMAVLRITLAATRLQRAAARGFGEALAEELLTKHYLEVEPAALKARRKKQVVTAKDMRNGERVRVQLHFVDDTSSVQTHTSR